MVSVELSESITETLDILEHMEKSYVDKIPKKFKNFLEQNKSLTYKPQLNHTENLKDMKLKDKTKNILATIYVNYWCNEKQKEDYIKLLKENEIKYQEELKEKYNTDNLFKKNQEEISNTYTENLPIKVSEKQNIFVKIVNYVKNLIKK